MILKGIEGNMKPKLVKSYPVLIVSAPSSGKSSAIEFLSTEDKTRTVILDADNKDLPEDDLSLYKQIIKIKPIENELDLKDTDNIKYREIYEIIPLLKKAIQSPNVDRVIIDTFSNLVSDAELYFHKTANGYDRWKEYNDFLAEFFSMIKSFTKTYGKFVYVFGHYKPNKSINDLDGESFCFVKGNVHYRLVESHFNTVITLKDFKFVADNLNSSDSTKIRRDLSPFSTKVNSLDELEKALTSEKTKSTDLYPVNTDKEVIQDN
jgi:hypothetical protein